MIKDIGVVGLGLMGCSISCCLITAGYHVTAVEKDEDKLGLAAERISGFLKQLSDQDLLNEPSAIVMERFTVSNQLSDLERHQLILETITEDIVAKQALYHLLEEIVLPTTIIGSNTSAISISTLQLGMRYPERLVGIHWGEPAHISRFMEIIMGDQSSLACAETVLILSKQWGKDPVLVRKDINGFIANRLMYALFREAFYLLENGYASMEDIDRACRNDIGMWMGFAGPFRYMDLTGVSAYAKVMEQLLPDLNNATNVPITFKSILEAENQPLETEGNFYQYSTLEKAKWEKMFLDFSTDIRKLTEEYNIKANILP